MKELAAKVKTQKGIVVDQVTVPGANHFFQDKIDDLMMEVDRYLDMRLGPAHSDAIAALPAPVISLDEQDVDDSEDEEDLSE